MPRFMIQVDHQAETSTCNRTVQVFLATGTHYLTHADWGCRDGVHTSWMVVEVGTREEARAVVPPVLRGSARVIALNHFGNADLEQVLSLHRAGGPPRPEPQDPADADDGPRAPTPAMSAHARRGRPDGGPADDRRAR